MPYLKTVGLYNAKAKNLLARRASWSSNTAGRFLAIAKRSKNCRAWAARPRASF